MKLVMSLFLMLSIFMFACNDDVKPGDVPAAVSASLQTTFPNATGIEWEKKGDNYEADFDVNNVDHEALISPSGEMLQYKHDITEAQLPEAVKTAIAQNYSNQRPDDVDLFSKGGATYYQIEFDNSGPDTKVVFSEDGREVTDPAYWED